MIKIYGGSSGGNMLEYLAKCEFFKTGEGIRTFTIQLFNKMSVLGEEKDIDVISNAKILGYNKNFLFVKYEGFQFVIPIRNIYYIINNKVEPLTNSEMEYVLSQTFDRMDIWDKYDLTSDDILGLSRIFKAVNEFDRIISVDTIMFYEEKYDLVVYNAKVLEITENHLRVIVNDKEVISIELKDVQYITLSEIKIHDHI